MREEEELFEFAVIFEKLEISQQVFFSFFHSSYLYDVSKRLKQNFKKWRDKEGVMVLRRGPLFGPFQDAKWRLSKSIRVNLKFNPIVGNILCHDIVQYLRIDLC